MTGSSVELVGADRLESTLHDAAKKLEDLSAVNRDVAGVVAKAARPPRRTGRLAGSIRPLGTATEAAVTSALPYAGVIENGWPRRNIRASHFLQRAFADTQTTTTAMYAKALQGIADDVKGA